MSAQPAETPQTWSFEAVWPIVVPLDSCPGQELYEEAVADLPRLARQHGAELTGTAAMYLVKGAHTPGSQGAEWCITATVPARPRSNAHRPKLSIVPPTQAKNS